MTDTSHGQTDSTSVYLAPPGRTRLFRLYGRVVPASLRARIRRRMSSSLRDQLLRLVAIRTSRQGGGISRIWAGRRLRTMVEPELAVARTEQWHVIASVLPQPSHLAIRRLVADEVEALLRQAGVPYFWVRGYRRIASVVAVPASARPTVLAALRQHGAHRPLYLAPVSDDRVGKPRLAQRSRERRLRHLAVIRVSRYVVDASGSLLFGTECGCDIEFWPEKDGRLWAPRPNRMVDSVPVHGDQIRLPEADFTPFAPRTSTGPELLTRVEFAGRTLTDVPFPIDVVYTWVDGADPAWQARRDMALQKTGRPALAQSANEGRYADHDELRYSLRSLRMYAPWVRKVWLVTDDQVPPWLRLDRPDLEVVSHKQIFRDPTALPVFNSHAIEAQLHHIEGLAEHFLYLNDDVFFGRPLLPQHFFTPNGLSKVFPSRAKVPPGPVDPAVDIPSSAAGKNNRRLIERDFRLRLVTKMKHTPHALRRSLLWEIERRYAEEISDTIRQPFRSPTDVSLASSLYQHYAYATGRAVLGELRNLYVDISSPEFAPVLTLLGVKRNYDVFCLNDTVSNGQEHQAQTRLVQSFLARYFPIPSPWEEQDEHFS